MNFNNESPKVIHKLLLERVAQLAEENALTPNYDKISKYIKEFLIIDLDNDEKRTRKAKFVLNKQIYEEAIERNNGRINRLVYTPEVMDSRNAIWNFSRAEDCFVMSRKVR